MVSTGPDETPAHQRRVAIIRGTGFVLAIALSGVALWLIVTSTSQKRLEVGVLCGLWGLLLGYFVLGSRPHHPLAAADPGTALELRSQAALARADDLASQQDFQLRLEAMLRREVQQGVARELVGLRQEVSALRSEILEKVGGQLRMERTETTRLFGTGLEELQREVRQLKVRQLREPAVGIDRATRIANEIDANEIDAEEVEEVEVDEVEVVEVGPAAPAARVVVEKVTREAETPFRPVRPASAFETVASRGPGQSATTAHGAAAPHDRVPIEVPAYVPPAPARVTQPAGPAPMAPAPMAPPPMAPAPMAPAAQAAPEPAAVPQPFEPLVPHHVRPEATTAPTPMPRVDLPPVPRFDVRSGPRVDVSTVAEADTSVVGPAVAAPVPPSAGMQPADMFASMPRLTPFTDFDLDPVERPAARGAGATAPTWSPAAVGSPSAEPASAPRLGRHSNPEGDSDEPQSGGRRHRSDDSNNDTLARILARERS